MDPRHLVAIIFLIAAIPVLMLELPILLEQLPKWCLKFLCFVPCGAAGFIAIKLLLESGIILFLFMSFFFCITLYGAFALKDIISSRN